MQFLSEPCYSALSSLQEAHKQSSSRESALLTQRTLDLEQARSQTNVLESRMAEMEKCAVQQEVYDYVLILFRSHHVALATTKKELSAALEKKHRELVAAQTELAVSLGSVSELQLFVH